MWGRRSVSGFSSPLASQQSCPTTHLYSSSSKCHSCENYLSPVFNLSTRTETPQEVPQINHHKLICMPLTFSTASPWWKGITSQNILEHRIFRQLTYSDIVLGLVNSPSWPIWGQTWGAWVVWSPAEVLWWQYHPKTCPEGQCTGLSLPPPPLCESWLWTPAMTIQFSMIANLWEEAILYGIDNGQRWCMGSETTSD